MTPLCCCHDNSFAAGTVLVKTEIPGFVYLTQPNDGREDNMGTMTVRSKTLWFTLEIGNGDIYFFDRKRLEPKKLLWQQH